MCERWVGDWTNCNILTPNSSILSSTSFSFCWAVQLGVLSTPPAGSCFSQPRTATNWLQLTQPVCSTGLYNHLTSTLWTSHLHPNQPVHSQGYTLISSTGCTYYLHRCISYLTARPRVNMLHNDCWHGFWVRSWWPCVLWQAVTLWLVNRRAVRQSRPVEQVCNRKETTWYENHVVSFRQSVQSKSKIEPGIRNQSEVLESSLTIRLARRCKRWDPLTPGRISQTYNKLCASLENKWERYIFINKCVSFR